MTNLIYLNFSGQKTEVYMLSYEITPASSRYAFEF